MHQLITPLRRLALAAVLALCALLPVPAMAQALTPAQMQTLKSLAGADPTAAGYMATADDIALAAWYNTATTYVIWHPAVTPERWDDHMMEGITQMDGLTVGKRDTLFVVTSRVRDCRDPNVVAAINDLTGSQNTLKARLVAACKRVATRAEQALSTGAGTEAAPGTAAWVGTLSYGEASTIRSQP